LASDQPATHEGSIEVAQEPQAFAAATEVVRLDREAERVGLPVPDQIALQDAALRQWVARRIIWVFVAANVGTLLALAGLVWLDQTNVASHMIIPGDRIITSHVFMALLGATTVQVGSIAFIIAQYLFPSRRLRDGETAVQPSVVATKSLDSASSTARQR
jgi:hypothetical protein